MRIVIAALSGLVLASSPVAAQDKQSEPDKPLTERQVTATDVVATPMDDLNLRKKEIPQLLLTAQERPYDLTGLQRCSQIAAAVGELEAMLGDDIDVGVATGRTITPGSVAREAVRVFIPFNGLIREISGANGQERKLQTAIYAGTARRSFLKGVGQARGCRYPARSATNDVLIARDARLKPPRDAVQPAVSGKQR